MFFYYLNQLILGDFKWTILGCLLLALGLFLSWFVGRFTQNKVLKYALSVAIVVIVVWYGHELIDPLFHALELYWNSPLGEPIHL